MKNENVKKKCKIDSVRNVIYDIKLNCPCISLLMRNGTKIYFCDDELKKCEDIEILCKKCIEHDIIELMRAYKFFIIKNNSIRR